MPHTKFERLAHITNHIFAKGYLPSKVRSAVSWKRASGKHVEECVRVDDLLSAGEGVSEEKPLRIVIGRFLQALRTQNFMKSSDENV